MSGESPDKAKFFSQNAKEFFNVTLGRSVFQEEIALCPFPLFYDEVKNSHAHHLAQIVRYHSDSSSQFADYKAVFVESNMDNVLFMGR